MNTTERILTDLHVANMKSGHRRTHEELLRLTKRIIHDSKDPSKEKTKPDVPVPHMARHLYQNLPDFG